MTYEVVAITYDGKKLVRQSVPGATINAGSYATFQALAPLNEVLEVIAVYAVAPSPGALSMVQNVTVSTNSVAFTVYAGTTTTVSTFELVLLGV